MNNKVKKGFSLIELMVVVAIIAVLAAVALPAYKNYILISKFSESMVMVGDIRDKIIMVYNQYGSFFKNGYNVADPSLAQIGYPNSWTMPATTADYLAPPYLALAAMSPIYPVSGNPNCQGARIDFEFSNYVNGSSLNTGPSPGASQLALIYGFVANGDTIETACTYFDEFGNTAATTPNLFPGCVYDPGQTEDAIFNLFTELNC